MKRLRTNSAWAKKKYSTSLYVELGGVGTRRLSEREIARMQAHVDRMRSGDVAQPVRLEVPA